MGQSKYGMNEVNHICQLFNLEPTGSLKKIQEFKGHSEMIQDIVWHPGRESVFVSTSKDKTIKMWDINNKTSSSPINSDKTPGQENINLAMSPDGNFLGVSNMKDDQEGLSFYDTRKFKVQKQIKYKVDINGF